MLGIRKHSDIENELAKVDITWKTPFGYIFTSTDDGEWSKGCTTKEIEKQVDIIAKNSIIEIISKHSEETKYIEAADAADEILFLAKFRW